MKQLTIYTRILLSINLNLKKNDEFNLFRMFVCSFFFFCVVAEFIDSFFFSRHTRNCIILFEKQKEKLNSLLRIKSNDHFKREINDD